LFEARLNILDGLVDAYILLESNYSSYGTQKPLRFLEKFQSGWMEKFQATILYVFLPFFPKAGETNGWYADSFLRNFLGKNGIPLLQNTRPDDVFLLLDADELPDVDALLFLKLFDGWSEPVKFGFRWTVFGFYWLKAEDPGAMESLPFFGKLFKGARKEKLLTLYVACTLGMLKEVYGNNAFHLRRNVYENKLLKERVQNYTKTHDKLKEWTLGASPYYAGHHCSWCTDPQGIRLKLETAQRHDKPRWGDYPEKLDLDYIQGLIETGGWFDGSRPFIPAHRALGDESVYAPKYFVDNWEKYKYLLEPPVRSPP